MWVSLILVTGSDCCTPHPDHCVLPLCHIQVRLDFKLESHSIVIIFFFNLNYPLMQTHIVHLSDTVQTGKLNNKLKAILKTKLISVKCLPILCQPKANSEVGRREKTACKKKKSLFKGEKNSPTSYFFLWYYYIGILFAYLHFCLREIKTTSSPEYF